MTVEVLQVLLDDSYNVAKWNLGYHSSSEFLVWEKNHVLDQLKKVEKHH